MNDVMTLLSLRKKISILECNNFDQSITLLSSGVACKHRRKRLVMPLVVRPPLGSHTNPPNLVLRPSLLRLLFLTVPLRLHCQSPSFTPSTIFYLHYSSRLDQNFKV
ncbi:Uncharacterized protein HZ326_14566 [Fusarium oxysporum f. sp. albedinis]|nr:Uncharacterized protein HZ326_14566 [Fusarium oxysporum f. sp. albedinis]